MVSLLSTLAFACVGAWLWVKYVTDRFTSDPFERTLVNVGGGILLAIVWGVIK